LCLRPGEKLPTQKLNKERVRYLLWVLYPVLKPDLILAPTHRDLQWLAAEIADFLVEAFAAAYLIDDWADETFLPYLLRRHKGDYFRNRYPSLSII
jgi:hypothetical protein